MNAARSAPLTKRTAAYLDNRHLSRKVNDTGPGEALQCPLSGPSGRGDAL
jgi:hypothetical protein